MANSRKKTVRLEVDLASNELDDGVVVNYRELVEKDLATSDENEATPPPSPQLRKNCLEGQLLPNLRRKAQSWNIPDFRILAAGYEQDSFIDDSEMYEESMTDSVKDLGYQIRSKSSDSDMESESESETLSGYSSLSDPNCECASVTELDEYESTTPISSKKSAQERHWSEFLKVLSQNKSLEIISSESKKSLGRPAKRPPSPTRRPETTASLRAMQTLVGSLVLPTKRCREVAAANNCKDGPQSASAPSKPIIVVDLCCSPLKEESKTTANAVTSTPVASGPLPSPLSLIPPCTTVSLSSPPALAATSESSTPDMNRALDPDCSSSSLRGNLSRTPDSDLAAPSPSSAASSATVSPHNSSSETTNTKSGPGKRQTSGGKMANRLAPAKVNRAQRSGSSVSFKRSAVNKKSDLPPDITILLNDVITNRTATEKWKCESHDDGLVKLGEACKHLPPNDRMCVYERMASHWGISPKKVSRRLSRLRSTSDKQPVKACLSRLQALLVAESKLGNALLINSRLSPASAELVAAALRAKSLWLERHPPRKGGLVDALEDFAQKELLALWMLGGPGAAAYGPHAPHMAAAVIEREFQSIVSAAGVPDSAAVDASKDLRSS